jgi:general secretion pathway protein J
LSTSDHNRGPSAAAGFTLAEILIAIAIFALLVSTIMGSFSGVFAPAEAIAVQRHNNAMARACLMRMTMDLGNIYVERPPLYAPPQTTGEPPVYRFVSAAAADNASPQVLLQFASRAHVDLSAQPQQGIAVIRYYLEATDEGPEPMFRLRRSDVLADAGDLPELRNDPILCTNVRSIQLAYLDGEGATSDDWDSFADDQNYATPRAVRIRIELATPVGPAVYRTVVTLPMWRPPTGNE